ncbi:MAG: SRPBCC family protein [Solirubrobacterales bacterium]
MVTLAHSVCIDAPQAEVWRRLSQLEEIQLWSSAAVAARCEGPVSRGVGAERTCDLKGGITITERWLAWDEGRSFVYEGSAIPLVAHARNDWSLAAAGAQTLLTTRADVVLRGGPAGRLLEPLVAFQSRRMGRRALAAFKYLAETGKPPPARHPDCQHPPAADLHC